MQELKDLNILINYANWRYHFARPYNTCTGHLIAGIDRVIEYSPADIDKDFRRRHRKLLRRIHGNGFWIWKPWIILKTLQEMTGDDLLIYSDADILFLRPVEPLIQRMEETGENLMTFADPCGRKERYFTKRDIFILLDCDRPEYTDTTLMRSDFHLWKKTEFSMRFAREWLDHLVDERISNDGPNRLGLPNYSSFAFPTYDQSVFSLLHKKYHLISHRSPADRPNPKLVAEFPDDRYPQLVFRTNRWVNSRHLILQGLWPACLSWLNSPHDLVFRGGRGVDRVLSKIGRASCRERV